MTVTVRPATEADFPALTRLDLTYPTSRYLAIERSGEPPEHTFAFRWEQHESADESYHDYTVDELRRFLGRADLFLVAEVEGRVAGLLTVLLPPWTDAADVGDLAVHRPRRRAGAGTALIDAAAEWARGRGRRALWVEPHANDGPAIEFYLRRGFRLSGFNDRLYSNQDDAPGRPTLYMHLEL